MNVLQIIVNDKDIAISTFCHHSLRNDSTNILFIVINNLSVLLLSQWYFALYFKALISAAMPNDISTNNKMKYFM